MMLAVRQLGLKFGQPQSCHKNSQTISGYIEWNKTLGLKESGTPTESFVGRCGILSQMPQQNRLNLPSAKPKQQADNKELWNEGRSPQGADFFTVGYVGRTAEEVLDLLLSNHVRTLIDIRQNPVSMYRPELSKGNLKRLAEEKGLIYEHFPELGVPRDIRAKAIETGSREAIWEWYDENVVDWYIGKNLHHFLNGFEHPVALMCVEVDPRECHRHRLFIKLEQMGLTGFDL